MNGREKGYKMSSLIQVTAIPYLDQTMAIETIKNYYDELAARYDEDRFGNTYGQYIDKQERVILRKHLAQLSAKNIVDIACGTGRFMNFCRTGLDLSEQMIAVAKRKYPDCSFRTNNALHTDLSSGSFQAAICFHLIMHLQAADLGRLLVEMDRILRPGGYFIFDIPGQERRTLLGHQQVSWHGSNAYQHQDILALLDQRWSLEASYGIAMFPIHRMPNWLRPLLTGIDTVLCRTFLQRYASYRVYIVRKK